MIKSCPTKKNKTNHVHFELPSYFVNSVSVIQMVHQQAKSIIIIKHLTTSKDQIHIYTIFSKKEIVEIQNFSQKKRACTIFNEKKLKTEWDRDSSLLTVMITPLECLVTNSLSNINGPTRRVWTLPEPPKPKEELPCKIPKLIIWLPSCFYSFPWHWPPIQPNHIGNCLYNHNELNITTHTQRKTSRATAWKSITLTMNTRRQIHYQNI